jgi:non-ribosomal peptide synthetase-like protein
MTLLTESTINDNGQPNDEPFLLHHYFERAAERWPDRIALEIPPGTARLERRRLTYAQLASRADTLARDLRDFAAEDRVVAILLPRSTEYLYISQLAVLKAGAAYTCIDPASPDQQVADILDDSGAVMLLTDDAGARRVAHSGLAVDRILDAAELSKHLDTLEALPPARLTANSLAYLIYTSGTTGRSKGVMIEHGAISNLVASDIEEFGFSPVDRVAQNSSCAYDSSVEEIWLAFAAGATLVVVDDEAVRLGPDLVPWLRRERISVFCPPPTLLRATGCADPEAALPALSFVYVGGEALPKDIADRWAKGRRLVNGYGPTECSVTSLRDRIREGEPITIGRPIRGLQAWALNDSLEEVAVEERGELCIGGIGLARGYLNRPELTAEKFPQHPRLGRVYRTGDLVHRASDGRFFYHGRIDSQVKLRGYRIELEAIESRLAECVGVRQAACRVQGDGAQQTLVGFIVPEDGLETLSSDDLKASLLRMLPAYMVPSRFAMLSSLPVTVAGKLNRNELPFVELQARNGNGQSVTPRNEMEVRIESAFREVLRSRNSISVHDDFFTDLGGDSLNAAELISLLRDHPSTASIAVRDLYEARTVAALAARTKTETGAEASIENEPSPKRGRPMLASVIQGICLLLGLTLGSAVAYFAAADVLPFLVRSLGLIPFLVLGPALLFAGLLVYTPVAVVLVATVKKLLIGRYRPLREPVWGSFYVRNWIVQKTVRIVPWTLLQGTVFQAAALRALGARIGRRVHIHRGVNLLQGGWDLLEIGDDVTISQDAAIRLVDFDDGQVVVGRVSIGNGSKLDVRAGVAGNTHLESDACLTALSSLPEGGRIPRGECWDGIPAKSIGESPPRAASPDTERILSPFSHGVATILARFALALILAAALELPSICFALVYKLDSERVLDWLYSPSLDSSVILAAMLVVTLPGPVVLAIEATIMRALGPVHAGVISRWSLSYIRVWLKTQLVQSAGEDLSGTLFWPVWLRLAGMRVGRGCEISTITDVVPELVDIGDESFLADGIYLGGPQVHQGSVTLGRTQLGVNTFLGNHCVVAAGQQLPNDTLLGVCTVADDAAVREGTAWFGHPPFELPRRAEVQFDRAFTHEPSLVRYLNRLFWEFLRFALPVVPVVVFPVWFKLLFAAESTSSPAIVGFVITPLLSLGVVVFFCFFVLGLKWALLGRVRPGVHVFWSCWCSRWDFVYVAWAVLAHGALSMLEGTLFLSWYLRLMGVRIGKGVVLGGGFSQVVDPDMLSFENGATVSCQFQAHTFEDRVLKIDRVTIRSGATVGSGAVLLYGADIGAGTHVGPHSVVMKRESLLPGRVYAGAPTRPITGEEAIAGSLV